MLFACWEHRPRPDPSPFASTSTLSPGGFSSPLQNPTVALAGWDQEQWHGARGEPGTSGHPASPTPCLPSASPRLLGCQLPPRAEEHHGLLRGVPLHAELPRQHLGQQRHRGHLVQGLQQPEDRGVPLGGPGRGRQVPGPSPAPGGPGCSQLHPAAAGGDPGGQRALQIPLRDHRRRPVVGGAGRGAERFGWVRRGSPPGPCAHPSREDVPPSAPHPQMSRSAPASRPARRCRRAPRSPSSAPRPTSAR